MLAELLNIPTASEEQMKWSFAHQDQHLKVNNAVFLKHGINLPPYILDPMPAFDSPNIGTWAYTHQAAHSAFDAVLNLGGSDFTSIDFTKQDQVESWIRLHFDDHYQAQVSLGYND